MEVLAHNPRNKRSENHDDASDLVGTLQEHGLLQPLGVVPAEAFTETWPEHADAVAGARWVVMVGNRRLAAARMAGLDSVPVHEVALTDAGEVDVMMLVENVHRRNLSPLAEAETLAELVERHGSQSAVARALSKPQSWVSQRIALKSLAPELQHAVEAGDLTIANARRYTSLPHDEQVATYHAVIATNGHTTEGKAGGADLSPRDSSTPPRNRPAPSGISKATKRFTTAVTELTQALRNARSNGTSPDELHEALEGIAKQLDTTVDDLPPAVRAAAGLDPTT